MISIIIPSEENFYHVFAEGVFCYEKQIENETEITLDDTYPFILYYYFPHHNRIYICSTETKIKKSKIYNVNKEFGIVCILEGRRSFDRFKNTMDYLKHVTYGEVYKLPVQYFWQLAYLCKFGLNNSFNIEKLTKRYNLFIKYDKDLKWSEKKS